MSFRPAILGLAGPYLTKELQVGKHSQNRDSMTGRWARVDTSNTPLAADSKFGPSTDLDVRMASADDVWPGMEVQRYGPAGDELAQGGDAHLAERKPIEINGDSVERFGQQVSEVHAQPGVPAELFGGRGIMRHDLSHGGMQRLLSHRQAIEIDGQTGEALRDVPDHELRARVPDLRTNAHLAAAEGDPFAANLMGAVPEGGYPETRVYRRVPGTDGYRVPAMGQSDCDAELRGGR